MVFLFKSRKRVIIAHGHIFKNAGTTFDWSLERNFGSEFYDHRDDESMIKSGASYLKTFLKENKKIKAISSHFLCYPLPELKNTKILRAYIFRHPIERTLSVYNFERKQDADTPGAIYAKKSDFPDYIKWRMRTDVGATIRDFHTRYCVGEFKKNIMITEELFQKAVNNIMNTELIGLVDKYNESMIIFEDRISKFYPSINLAYIKQNVSDLAIKLQSQEDKINKIKNILDNETYQRLLENNQFDMQLYEIAKRKVDDDFKKINGHDSKFKEFNERCKNLRLKKALFY